MTEAVSSRPGPGSVSILFHPCAVPVLDVFRSLDRLGDQYDLTLLDAPERALTSFAGPEHARAIVSEALLLAFTLGRQRSASLEFRALESRLGSVDEYCLVALIAASRIPESELALEARAALGISSHEFVMSLAGNLIRQIDRACLAFEAPDLAEFRAVIGDERVFRQLPRGFLDRPSFRFRF